MVKTDVVAYLRANLKKHPLQALRGQLAEEGVSEDDFNDSLKAARARPSRASLVLLAGGVAIVAALAALLLSRPRREPPPAPSKGAAAAGESAFVGHTGYIIRLPKGYEAVAGFKDAAKTIEIVHFCRAGTDPTNFLNEALFGQMGIVRLEVRANPFAGSLLGIERLGRAITQQLTMHGAKFSPLKSIQVASLRGLQVEVQLPDPSVETYFLGEDVMYEFYGGQDDDTYRDIVNSLRDPHAEAL